MGVIINLIIMIVLIGLLYSLQKKYVSFTKRVFTALALGVIFGGLLQLFYGRDSQVISDSNTWFYIISGGYVRLLKMIVTPLVMVSIVSAIINIKDGKTFGKIGGSVVALLIGTTAVSALIGAGSSLLFKLSAVGMSVGEREASRGELLVSKLSGLDTSMAQKLVETIPTNPFAAMAGSGDNATISVVIFSAFIGIAVLGITKKHPESVETARKFVNSAHDIVMRMVTLILRLTPYGIMALMVKVVSTSNTGEILNLINFVLASYVALAVVLLMHLMLVTFAGLNPVIYLKKIFPVLAFAFTSRTSAGTIPLNIQTQIKKLGVSEGVANISASFGASIGQNGCAGIYPAMLAVMIAPTVGIDPTNPVFILKVVVIVALSSFGVAGVGGGATFAALIVLSALNLPVALVGLLISIEPLIDMGRTAINVSGAMTAGTLTSKFIGDFDSETYENQDIELEESVKEI